jgi:hypothetical protein
MPPSTDVPAWLALPRINTAYDVTGWEGMLSSWKYISSWRMPNVSPWFAGVYQQLLTGSLECHSYSLRYNKHSSSLSVSYTFFVKVRVFKEVYYSLYIKKRSNLAKKLNWRLIMPIILSSELGFFSFIFLQIVSLDQALQRAHPLSILYIPLAFLTGWG